MWCWYGTIVVVGGEHLACFRVRSLAQTLCQRIVNTIHTAFVVCFRLFVWFCRFLLTVFDPSLGSQVPGPGRFPLYILFYSRYHAVPDHFRLIDFARFRAISRGGVTSYQAQSRIHDRESRIQNPIVFVLEERLLESGDHLPMFFSCRRRLYWRYRRLWTMYTAMYTPGIAPRRPQAMYSALAIDLVRSGRFQCPFQRFLGDSTPIPRSSLVRFLVL